MTNSNLRIRIPEPTAQFPTTSSSSVEHEDILAAFDEPLTPEEMAEVRAEVEAEIKEVEREVAKEVASANQETPAFDSWFARSKPKLTNFISDKTGDYALEARDILQQLQVRPVFSVEEQLFYDDGTRILPVNDANELFSVLSDVFDVEWFFKGRDDRGLKVVNKTEFFSYLRMYVKRYAMVSRVPLYPVPPNVYIPAWVYPQSKHSSGQAVFDLISMFNPASAIDRDLLLAAILTPFWGGPPGQRPLFVITGREGIGIQGIGKTSTALLLSELAGGAFQACTSKNDELTKQTLSQQALQYSTILVDNLVRVIRSAEFAQALTADFIHGRAAYGRQSKRLNVLTWIATAVSPEFDNDISERSVLIELEQKPEDADPYWESNVRSFIEHNRQKLLADVLWLLEHQERTKPTKHLRQMRWCVEVLGVSTRVDEIIEQQALRKKLISVEDSSWLDFLVETLEKMKVYHGGRSQVVRPRTSERRRVSARASAPRGVGAHR
jgi:hypothetical protein